MSNIKLEEENGVFKIILNRAEKRNAFNAEMIKELKSAFLNAQNSNSARVILLSGSGQSFCAGADIEWMKSMKSFSFVENKKDSEELFDMFDAARMCTLPIVTKAQGHVMGGANGLLAVSDFVVAEESTKFAFSEVKIGLVPAVISPFVMQKMIKSSAREKMLTGRLFNADEALAGGLVEFVCHDGESDEVVHSLIEQLLDVGPQALRSTKVLLKEIETSSNWKDVKELTTRMISERRVSDEGQEGLTSFLEKKKPSWLNRSSH